MKKYDKLRKLLKEQIRKVILKEGFQAADNIYLSMYEDNIVLTQSFNGSESDMGQKIEISMKDFPKILDGLFNLVPVNRIPANYRQSMIAKLSDKAIGSVIIKSRFLLISLMSSVFFFTCFLRSSN